MAINYTKTNWVNGQAPAISASNLNKIEQGIKDACDLLDGLLVVETYTSPSESIGPNNYDSISQNVTKPGYYPIGIVGTYFSSSAMASRGSYITNVTEGACEVVSRVRNTSSSTASTTANEKVLWIKL